MMSRTTVVLLLSLIVPNVLAQDCKLPSWTIKDIKIKTYDAVGNSGSASFTLVPDDTGKAESLTCARLQGNYRCNVKSKVDTSVEVDLQINTGIAHMSVTQMKFPCGSVTYALDPRFALYCLTLDLVTDNCSLPDAERVSPVTSTSTWCARKRRGEVTKYLALRRRVGQSRQCLFELHKY